MNKKIISLLLAVLTAIIATAQVNLEYYLPQNVILDPNIPTPASVLGHEVGDWHVSHDKLVYYMYELARTSERIKIEEYGRTYENRPLLLLKISSEDNIKNLDQLQIEHSKLSDYRQSSDLSLDNMPAVVYLGYSVHGDEPSGSNAALLVAYYLAAAKGNEVDRWLEQTIVLLDPSYNPDGLNRFANWVNSKKSKNLVSDPGNIEQNEPWPEGRTNHYWFDLNRDWLPVQHPESKGRVSIYHRWKPNILTDHHEMGSNNTFFFQPGIPSRNNPLTPENNYVLTQKIAKHHAAALDEIGSFYYSKESFDDFYIGKGSSYPDINGGIGILFEQASTKGHSLNTIHGKRSFPFAIRNHFTTSLSTLRACFELKDEILAHQQKFYNDIPYLADRSTIKGFIFKSPNDLSKLKSFLSILETHQIEVYKSNKSISGFKAEDSFIIPLKQNQFRMVQAIFETRTTFNDSLFYDVSAWTLPLAFDLDCVPLTQKDFGSSLLGKRVETTNLSSSDLGFEPSQYAYAFHWLDSQSPALLYDIQSKGLRTMVSTEPWTTKNQQKFDRGAIVIPAQNQPLRDQEIYQLLINLAHKHKISIVSISSGDNPDLALGSPKFKALSKPKPLLVIGSGINPYEAGEVWHLMDQRIGLALPMVTQEKLNSIELSSYDQIILVGGSYGTLSQSKIKTWLQSGGEIIASKGGSKWLSEAGLSKVKFKKIASDSTRKYLPYNERVKSTGAQRIGGSIFMADLDLTHPLCFGFQDGKLPLFKKGVMTMELAKNPYSQPIHYSSAPLLAGYISDENLVRIPDTPAVSLSAYGQGLTIAFIDNLNFRAYWLGSSRVFLNALFFGSIIESSSAK
ncbi:MAG: M14 metallopeptidase family protein [Reichenbachiella sp.]|uniref:M14 metallopeptidase family protein n=1 Tax=Reichenbachiella sp. TaxID=2184521 RepID=UPI0032648FAD